METAAPILIVTESRAKGYPCWYMTAIEPQTYYRGRRLVYTRRRSFSPSIVLVEISRWTGPIKFRVAARVLRAHERTP